ncbi:hypothetical protein HDV64DRAFT_252218 [Trichoderma sp. TUCIM 5745]
MTMLLALLLFTTSPTLLFLMLLSPLLFISNKFARSILQSCHASQQVQTWRKLYQPSRRGQVSESGDDEEVYPRPISQLLSQLFSQILYSNSKPHNQS